MEYIPHGVCSRLIHIDLDGDTIKSVEFVGGCSGLKHGKRMRGIPRILFHLLLFWVFKFRLDLKIF